MRTIKIGLRVTRGGREKTKRGQAGRNSIRVKKKKNRKNKVADKDIPVDLPAHI